MKKFLSLALVLSLLIGVMAGCAPETTTVSDDGSDSNSDLPVLRVATMPFLCSVPIRYMVEEKIDEKYGFRTEIIMFPTGAPMNEAIPADEWDIGTSSAAAVTACANYGATVIGHLTRAEGGMHILTRPESPIAEAKNYNPTYPDILGSPETVRDISIAYATGTLNHMHTNMWLEKIGVMPEEINATHMEQPAALQALLAGQVDAVAIGDDAAVAALNEGMVSVSEMPLLGAAVHDSIIASPNAFEDKQDLLVAFLKAIYESTDALMADPELEAQKLFEMFEENGGNPTMEACEAEVAKRPLITSEAAMELVVGESVVNIARFNASQELLEADKVAVVESLMDETLIREALNY